MPHRIVEDFGSYYQDIGRAAAEAAESLDGRLLLYAEAEEGVLSADLIYETGNTTTLAFKFCPDPLSDLIRGFWEAWGASEAGPWRTMAYTIEADGKFNIDLIYPDQVDEKEGLSDRRPRIIEKYFGNRAVDYSHAFD